MDSLAPELLEDILYHVYEDLSASKLSITLRNCSLVSHQWKEIAQPLLFSKLMPYGKRYDQIKLRDTLILYPHLRHLVKCIWLDTDISADISQPDGNSLIDLYRQLISNPRFQHLTLKQLGDNVKPQSYKTICDLVSSSHLTVLSAYTLRQFPIGIFYQCASVRELHLYMSCLSGFKGDGDGGLFGDKTLEFRSDRNRSTERPHLLHLYFESAFDDEVTLMKWFLHPDCAFDISELKTFHFLDMSNEVSSYTLARTLVGSVSSSLEDLALDPPTCFSEEDYYNNLDYTRFDPLPHLRRLKFSLQQDEFPEGTLWPWTINVLAGLSYPERLEELELPCILTKYLPENADKNHGWEDLDILLTSSTPLEVDEPGRHQNFSNLKSVRFGVVAMSSQTRDEEQRIGEALPSLLPRLHGLGILKVSFSTVIGFVEDVDCWYHKNSESYNRLRIEF
ncbi:hypothetical protein BDN72DRAFT_838419 [Pluteus cervinus]|uniref:Uncharacterized protein n=1 Tax=Pluteus cervinus TaxID=181527 RepID=A0ACD3AZY1_9AGAR|nr:hypothetical protein BDN72DRAFT_838419 [Pluteus cervinus]